MEVPSEAPHPEVVPLAVPSVEQVDQPSAVLPWAASPEAASVVPSVVQP
jgi:hypothetical protein